MEKVFHFHSKKQTFKAWHSGTVESRKANLFFQNRGRNEGEGEEEQWVYPEGQDPISLLPLDVAIKVITFTLFYNYLYVIPSDILFLGCA